MKRLLDIDGPVMQFITKIVYSAWLNILWMICCLPVVTVGASTTALFYVTLKIVKNEEGNITRAFFHSFRENFRQATLVWLILLGGWAMLKNSLMIGMRFLLCTVLMALVYLIMVLVVIRIFTPAVIFGEGLCALLCFYLLSNILELAGGCRAGT